MLRKIELPLYPKWDIINLFFYMGQITNQTKTRFSWLQSYGLAFTLFFYASHAWAQKIDFDKGNNSSYTANGYTAWDITDGASITNTFDGVTITITNAEGSAGSKIKKNWNKNGVTLGNDEAKLISDGISSFDGDSYIKSGSVAIQVTITGLSSGAHTLQAYHNNVDYEAGATLPALSVKVNGVDQKTGLSQSMRATTLAASTKSFVTFNVESTSSETVIVYYTTPVDGVNYDRTQLYINSLEIDGENADYQAQNPSPSNLDYHVNANNSNITLSWTSPSSSTKHIVYWGESEDQVNVKIYEGTGTTASRSGLSPLKTYYWRVDEVINGMTYKGNVWSFKPRRDAFPGAEGYGRYAIGGRGGTVYHVTSLDDDASNPAEGTFRYGITKVSGPRTIVFDVGGVIHLNGRLSCSDPYVTIAGQTAPGNGIMFRGAPFGMASDGITRFIRLRRGHISDEDPSENGNDGMGMAGNDHSIMDHCSISWTVDESFSSRNAKRITLQNTLISEALNIAEHPNYAEGTEHGYAATIGGGQLGAEGSSFHHNLLAHNEGRNWSMSGGLDAKGDYDGHHDMFNNVCYNWATRATDGGTHEGQFVNNYYKMGKSTTQTILLKADLEGTGSGTQSYYVSGNIRENLDGTQTSDALDGTYKYELYNNQVLDWTVFKTSPFFDHLATVESAQAAFKNVLSDVGCNQPVLDNHDTRMVTETKNGTYTYTGAKSLAKGRYGHIDSEEDSEGFGGLNINTTYRPDNWDTDGDGIPDWYENAKGWSSTVANNNNCTSSDYYTNLEEYLNWMAVPHFIEGVRKDETKQITLSTYFAGYTNPSYSVNPGTGITASISNGILNVTPSQTGLLSLIVTATQDNISLTRTFNFYVINGGEDVYNTIEQYTQSTYTISNTTYVSGNSNNDSYEFNQNGKNFTVTNTKNKGYGYGYNSTVKYSARVQYTINLPVDIEIEKIEFYGYDNYSDEDSYIGEVNGKSYGSNEYVFPKKANNTAQYVTHSITFDNPVTNSITFTPQGLQVCWAITLYTRSGSYITFKENATVYSQFNNASDTKSYLPVNNATVTLKRTLSNEYWNTLCIPFDVSAEQIEEVFGEGTKVSEFTSAENRTINFSSVDMISAGVPCVIMPAKMVVDPVFKSVNVSSTEAKTVKRGSYSYVGHYICYDLKTDQTEYFLNAQGKLNWPSTVSQSHMKGLRGTFLFPSTAPSLISMRVLFDEQYVSEGLDIVDGINAIEGLTDIVPVYNLNGQIVGNNREQLNKGIYIVKGKKIVVK